MHSKLVTKPVVKTGWVVFWIVAVVCGCSGQREAPVERSAPVETDSDLAADSGTRAASGTKSSEAPATGAQPADSQPSAAAANDEPSPDAEVADPPAPLELRAATPDEAAPLWVHSPIVLTFSAPLDDSSVSKGVRLASSTGPVDFAHRLDGETLTLEISTPPPALTTSTTPTTLTPLTLTITADLRDRQGNPAQPSSRRWGLPLWRTSSMSVDGPLAQPLKLARGRDVTWLVWQVEAGGGASIRVAQYDEHADQTLREVSSLEVETGARLCELVVDAQDRLVVAWRNDSEAPSAAVARFDGTRWQPLDAGLEIALAPGQPACPRLAIDAQDSLVIAWPTATSVELARWSLDGPWQPIVPAWQPMTAMTVTLGLPSVDIAWTESGAVLAVIVEREGERDLQVHRLEAGVWQALAEAVEHDPSDDVREAAIDVGGDGQVIVSWTEEAHGQRRLYVSRFSEQTRSFDKLGPALNVGSESDVELVALAASDGAAPVVGFRELAGGLASSYVARWNGSGFEVLGGSLDGRAGHGPAITLGSHGEPLAVLARADDAGFDLLQYNESPRPPFGLGERKPQPCTLPADSDDAFPRRLSDTGCYADLTTQTLAEGWVPYELNSPLWSDGAYKRRFLSIPDQETIGFSETDAWKLPVGTLLAKEFWLQRDANDPGSRFIVETRLLVKRCEPGSCRAAWAGYSYQWNAAGDEAMLLENNTETVFVEWPVDGGMHKHGYPGRDECTRCHAVTEGGALGLRTPQLNRNHAYPEAVDHQLRALFHAGLFGDAEPPSDLYAQFRLPTPSDPAYDNVAQVRGYFDANCSHCHSPSARWPVIDLRFEAELRADDGTGTLGNICNMIVPGDAEASVLFRKIQARPGAFPEGFTGDPMPPLGTLLRDEAHLARTRAWIDGMTSCP